MTRVCSCLVSGPGASLRPCTRHQGVTSVMEAMALIHASESELAALEQPLQASGRGEMPTCRSPHNYTANKHTENCQAATLGYVVVCLLTMFTGGQQDI